MAEYRTVRMAFWNDPFVEELEAGAKLLYLYLFTCPHANNLGVLEVTRKKIAFETGLSVQDVDRYISGLEQDGKVVTDGVLIWLVNFIKNQCSTSPKLVGALRALIPSITSEKIRHEVCLRYPHIFDEDTTVPIPSTYPIDTVPIPSREEEREEEGEIEDKNTASATPLAEPIPADTDAPKGKKVTVPPDEPHYKAKSGRYLTGKRFASFTRFWGDFAMLKGKTEAADAWLDIPKLTDTLVEQICYAAQCEARERGAIEAKGQTPKWAQGWLSARRWEDYPLPQQHTTRASPAPLAYETELTAEQMAAAKAVRERLRQEREAKQVGGVA